MAEPRLAAAPAAQLHLGDAGGSSRLRRAGIRRPRAFPDAPRRWHADGVAGGAPVMCRVQFASMVVKVKDTARKQANADRERSIRILDGAAGRSVSLRSVGS